MKKIVAIVIFSIFVLNAKSQQNEIGIFAGTSYYNGDYNKFLPFNPPALAYGLMYSRPLNNITTMRIQANKGLLKGKEPNSFSTSFYDLGLMAEINVFGFADKKLQERLIVLPYLETGVFVLLAPDNVHKVNLSIPVGIGIKYVVNEKVSLSAELVYHITNSDVLDEVNFDTHLVNKALKITNDYYSFAGFVLRYTFFEEDEICPAYRL